MLRLATAGVVALLVAHAGGIARRRTNRTKKTRNSMDGCWKPILEENGRGFYYRQEHVVPHLRAVRGMFYTKQQIDALEAPRPRYRYKREARILLQRLRDLTHEKKQDIVFFDNKLNIAVALVMSMMAYNKNFEEMAWFLAGLDGTNTDNAIAVWKEKVHHNLVRPTDVVRFFYPGRRLTVWDNQVIPSERFHPWYRTMPHAEYPSGSSCLCRGMHDFSMAAFKFLYPTGVGASYEAINVTKFILHNLAPMVPGTHDPFPTQSYSLPEMLAHCSQSRLDAGLHFTRSTTEGEKLCKGMGDRVWENMRALLAYPGDDAAAHGTAFRSTDAEEGGATGLNRTGCRAADPSEFKLPTFNVSVWHAAMGMPPFVSKHVVVLFWLMDSVTPAIIRYETPMIARIAYAVTAGFWNCVAAYNHDDLKLLRFGRGPVAKWTPSTAGQRQQFLGRSNISSAMYTSDARSVCAVHLLAALLPTVLPGEVTQAEFVRGPAFATFGLSVNHSIGLPTELVDCEGNRTCMAEYVSCRGLAPKPMGEAIAADIAWDFARDGWNSHGSCDNKDFCYPYEDTTGFQVGEGSCSRIHIIRWSRR